MSSIKFLFIFSIKKESTKALGYLSLRKGVQIFSIFTLISLCINIFLEFIKESTHRAIIKISIFSFFIIPSIYLLMKSTSNFDPKTSLTGYKLHSISFYINTMSLIVLALVNDSLFMYGNNHMVCWIISSIFMVIQLYFNWIIYNYHKQLSLGNDALVDGQPFNRYFENMAPSEKSSRNSTPRQSPINSRRVDDSFELGANANANVNV
jgi:hypothetical protein